MNRIAACLVISLLCLSIPCAARAEDDADVTLKAEGDKVILSNGILAATIERAKARITSLRFRGFEMLASGYYSMDGGRDYRTPDRCAFTVKTNSPDLVDIGMKRIWRDEPQAFDIEIHYVLRRGDSGLYTYALLDHPSNYPATKVGEWRMVWKLSDELLERIHVDDLRHWQMQSPSDRFEATPIREIIKVTSGIRAGKFDCKYDYSANYHDLGCWGHASDRNKIGGWIVLGSHEFFNDGPTKQDLTAASGLNHIHFGMNHYNGSITEVAAGQEWQKLYGPFLLYCNHDDRGGDACWAEAQARARTEQAAWPYTWLTGNPAYPQAEVRGQVTGRFVVDDPLKPELTGAHAWVGLAQPWPGGNWQFDSMHYQYWAKADESGRFTIPHVRPGRYTLFAFTTGAVGEYSQKDIEVTVGKTTELGDVRWTVPHAGRSIAWEIGVPDRTAREFRHGRDYFQGYLWEQFADEFSNPLEYTIGKSDPARDWNYAHAGYRKGELAEPHRWRIHFDLAAAPAGAATLTLAIASADRAHIQVFVNDEQSPLTELTPAVQGGNALLREGIHAKYCVETVSIPADRLRAGANVITLVQPSVRNAGSHVMYDYLSLELP